MGDEPYVIRIKDGATENVTQSITIENKISIECWKNSINNNRGTDNTSGGGGVFVAVNGTFSMANGAIKNNSAVHGGGVYLSRGSDTFVNANFSMEGGVISGNSATNYGKGVYADGTFGMKGSAYVKSYGDDENDVFLPGGKKITVKGALNPPAAANGIVAKITPSSYSTSSAVLGVEEDSGVNLADVYGKFAVTPQTVSGNTTEYHLLGNGYMTNADIINTATTNANITDPSEPYVLKDASNDNSGQIDINHGEVSTEDRTYNITFDNVYREYPDSWASGFSIFNKSEGTTLTVNINLIGENIICGHNHGGFKLSSECEDISSENFVINVVFDTMSTGTFSFDASYSGTRDLQIENVTSNISIAAGCTFTGRVGGTDYTNPSDFFAAAANSTNGSTFTITRQ